MRVLVVSWFFPPEPGIGAVRVGKTVRHLERLGHDVRVLAAAPPGNAPSAELRVVRTRAGDAFGKAQRLLQRGRAATGRAHASASSGTRGPVRPSALRRALHWLMRAQRALLHMPDASIGWYPFALRGADRLLRNWTPDVILASATPYTSLLVGRRLARRLGVPWVAELRDLWTDNHYYDLPDWRRRIDRRIEHDVLTSAAGLVTVSEPLAERLRARFDVPVAVVMNGFDPEDLPFPEGGPGAAGGVLRIGHFGRIYEGRRNPAVVFDGLALLPAADRADIEIDFYGPGLEPVIARAAAVGVASSVQVHPSVPRAQSLMLQSFCDVLLLLMWDHPEERAVYTGKLFEYLASRRPVLATGSRDSVACDLIRRMDAGFVAEDADAAAAWLVQRLAEKRSTGKVARVVADLSELERGRQVERLAAFLDHVRRS